MPPYRGVTALLRLQGDRDAHGRRHPAPRLREARRAVARDDRTAREHLARAAREVHRAARVAGLRRAAGVLDHGPLAAGLGADDRARALHGLVALLARGLAARAVAREAGDRVAGADDGLRRGARDAAGVHARGVGLAADDLHVAAVPEEDGVQRAALPDRAEQPARRGADRRADGEAVRRRGHEALARRLADREAGRAGAAAGDRRAAPEGRDVVTTVEQVLDGLALLEDDLLRVLLEQRRGHLGRRVGGEDDLARLQVQVARVGVLLRALVELACGDLLADGVGLLLGDRLLLEAHRLAGQLLGLGLADRAVRPDDDDQLAALGIPVGAEGRALLLDPRRGRGGAGVDSGLLRRLAGGRLGLLRGGRARAEGERHGGEGGDD